MKAKILTITLGALGAIGIIGTGINAGNVNALSYQKNVDIGFKLEPSVSIKLSSSELTISDLAPGQSADSNIITLTAESNNSAGYMVTTTVGNSTYDTTNLKHKDNNVADVFSSLTGAGSLSAGKWGYSYATENSGDTWTNWSTYNGLPKYNDAEATPVTLIDESSAASNIIAFKIGAQANDDQAAGEYNNVVNFIATTKVAPSKLYMQNATSADCGQTMYDNRDDSNNETPYTTAKIGDLCWMTTNLNLAGGTQLSHDNTNVPENYSTTTAGFTNGNTLPVSSAKGFNNDNRAFVYNSNNSVCGSNQPCYSYYSWRAATAGYNATTAGTSVDYDICPNGWRLPTQTEFSILINAYDTGDKLVNAPFLAVYSGYYDGASYSVGEYGYYWSSTIDYTISAFYLDFGVNSANIYDMSHRNGASIRCIYNS